MIFLIFIFIAIVVFLFRWFFKDKFFSALLRAVATFAILSFCALIQAMWIQSNAEYVPTSNVKIIYLKGIDDSPLYMLSADAKDNLDSKIYIYKEKDDFSSENQQLKLFSLAKIKDCQNSSPRLEVVVENPKNETLKFLFGDLLSMKVYTFYIPQN